MKEIKHYMAEAIEKLANGKCDKDLSFRHFDLEEITDEPGNTGLYLTFIGVVDNDEDGDYEWSDPSEILSQEDLEDIDFQLDYEQLDIIYQNNEAVVIVNFNK